MIHSFTTFILSTLVIAIPVGLMLWAIYGALCGAGRQASLIIGIF